MLAPARISLLAVLLATYIPTTASAAENGHYMVIGVGHVSCGGWTKARRDKSWTSQAYESWVAGYFTAYNAWADPHDTDILAGTDMDGVSASIDNFCIAHPMSNIAHATENVLAEIYEAYTKKVIDNALAGIAPGKKP